MTTSTVPWASRPRPPRTPWGLEARERLDRHGEARVPLGERLEVLLHEQRRGHEHRDLLAVLDGLERRADRDLRLAVADVAAHEPVHGDRLLHVGLDLVDRRELVGRLDVRERVLELALPRRVGPNAWPCVAMRAEYRRMSSPAISLTCLRARDFVLAQSDPPILLRLGASPPVYFVTWSSWSMGTNRRSPGWPRLLDAYSITRYSRVAALPPVPSVRCTSSTKRPTPCCSCTTKSPALSWSGSTTLRRRLGILRMSRVLVPARPVRSASEKTARRSPGATKPLPTIAGVTRTMPPSGSSSSRGTRRAGVSAAPSCSTMRLAGPWPSVVSTSRQPACCRPRTSSSARHVAAIGLDVARAEREGRHAVGALADVGGRRARAVARRGGAPVGVRRDVQVGVVERERRQRPPAQPAALRDRAHLGERLERRRGQVHRRLAARHRTRQAAARTPPSSPPGRGRDGARARRRPRRGARRRARAPAPGPCGPRAPARDSMPSTATPAASRSSISVAPGRSSTSAARAPHRVREQDLAARRRPQPVLGDLQAALVRDREPADLRHLVAPELHAQRVVPPWAGRCRGCRHGPRTRRAARPCPRACTPPRRAAPRRP